MHSIREIAEGLEISGNTVKVLTAVSEMIHAQWTPTASMSTLVALELARGPMERLSAERLARIESSAQELFSRKSEQFENALAVYKLVDTHDQSAAQKSLSASKGAFSEIMGWFAPKPDRAQALDAGLKWAAEVLTFAILKGIDPKDALAACPKALENTRGADRLRVCAWITIDGLLPLGEDFVGVSSRIVSMTPARELRHNPCFEALAPHLPGQSVEDKRDFIADALTQAETAIAKIVTEYGLTRYKVRAALEPLVGVRHHGTERLSAALDSLTHCFDYTGRLAVVTSVINEASSAEDSQPPQPESDKTSFESAFAKARKLLADRELDGAVRSARALFERFPDRVEVYHLWHDLNLPGDNRQELAWALEKICELDPSPPNLLKRGVFLGRSGRYMEASDVQRTLWRQRANLSDDDALSVARDLLVTLSRLDGAPGMVQVANEAIDRVGPEPSLLYQRGYAHLLHQNTNGALEHTDAALDLVPQGHPIHAHLLGLRNGIVAQMAKDEEAIQTQLDGLVRHAFGVHRGSDMGANGRVWTFFYKLETVYVMAYPAGFENRGQAVVRSYEGKGWTMLFTSLERLHLFANLNHLSHQKEGAALAMTPNELRDFVRNCPPSVFGIRVNQGEHGFFSPRQNLDLIYDHLVKNGSLTPSKPAETTEEAGHLEELRDLFHQPPHWRVWQRVVSILEETAPEQRALAVQYCEGHLEDWPLELRAPNYEWSQRRDWEVCFKLVRSLDVTSWISGWLRHTGSSWRALDHDMELGYDLDGEITDLASAPWLENVRHLVLKPNGYSSKPFLSSTKLRKVTHLEIHCSAPEVIKLASASFLPSLRSLQVTSLTQKSPERRDAVSTIIGRLSDSIHTVSFDGLDLSPQMASQLAGFALRSLRLRSTYLDRESVQRLLKPPLLDALRHLDLTYNHIDGDDPNRPTVGQLLENIPHGIESLKLGHNNIGPKGAQQLAQCAALGQLRTLSLRNNPIGDEGVLALARSKHLDKLRTLVLREVGASMQSVEVLLSPGTLPALEKLTIVHNKIDKARVNRLAASRNLDLSALEDFYAE